MRMVATLGLEVAEFPQGAVDHSLEALLGGEEAFEGGVGSAVVVGRIAEAGAEGVGDQETGTEGLGRQAGAVIGVGAGVSVNGQVEFGGLVAEFIELAALVHCLFAQIGFFHEGEEVVCGLEAAETPGDADGALGQGELEGVHGAEALEEGVAVGVEEGLGFAGEEEVGGVGVVGGGVLGGGVLAGGGAGAGGFGGVGAVGGCAAGGAG